MSSLMTEFEFARIMRENVLPRAASVYARHYHFMQHVNISAVTFCLVIVELIT